MKRIAIVAAVLVMCSGCGFLDSLLMPGPPETPGGPPTPPPIIRVVSPISDAVPGYGGAIVGAVGLLAGLYQSIRKRQEEGKKISIMEGIDVLKENWDKVQGFPEVQKILREVAQKNGNAVAINKDLDTLRAKGTI